MDLSDSLTIRLDTFGTALCSLFSLIGSLIVIISYLFVTTITTRPRAARIILNLSIADCFWFGASFIQSCFWLFAGAYGEPGNVPVSVCYVCSPLVSLSRISSLLWTCVIAFETIQSVKSRTWHLEVEKLRLYDRYYLIFVYLFSVPGALLAIFKQHTGEHTLGCDPGYEKLGKWYEIVFTELIPIIGGFLFNIYAYFQVKNKLSSRAFPRSVRKRRKRVMYHYIIVCILCWCPTILFYLLELFGIHRPLLEVISRVCLYTTGFLNFLVFGMQDPHLSRSLLKVFYWIGLGSCVGVNDQTNLQRSAYEKTVMFENAQKTNADIAKDKKTVYRYHRLSKEERLHLYKIRPDLDLKSKTESLLDGEEQNDSRRSSQQSNDDDNRSQISDEIVLNHPRESSVLDESEVLGGGNAFSNAIKNIDGKVIRKESGGGADVTPTSNISSSTGSHTSMSPLKIGSDELIASPIHKPESPRSSRNSSPNRQVPSDQSPSIQERIQSLSSGYLGPNSQLDSFPDLEEGDEESKGQSISSRARLIFENAPSENRALSQGDSIFNTDHEEDESSSSDEEEENDIVGSGIFFISFLTPPLGVSSHGYFSLTPFLIPATFCSYDFVDIPPSSPLLLAQDGHRVGEAIDMTIINHLLGL